MVCSESRTEPSAARSALPGEDPVLASLDEAHRAERALAREAAAAGLPAADTIRALSRSIAADIRSPGSRGSLFLHAAAERPGPGHPAHPAVVAHRRWLLDTVAQLLARIRETPAEAAARQFVMLCDGAMVAGCLSDPVAAGEDFLRAVEALLHAHAASVFR
ncbi:TetR family transcriptional regulator [Streptomyces sp. NPDC020917]|uniref:TetR family transcriptional regulator n=1 Tax=Streptomyces sp. NPDC020917 TaxID=3365102 RepID=UPI0037951851